MGFVITLTLAWESARCLMNVESAEGQVQSMNAVASHFWTVLVAVIRRLGSNLFQIQVKIVMAIA